MTEAEWLRSTQTRQMLAVVEKGAPVRSLRLFACACCRRIWHMLRDERSRRAVEVAERYADGLATSAELADAALFANQVADAAEQGRLWGWNAARTATAAAAPEALAAAERAAVAVADGDMLREVFGNPWRVPKVDSIWLTWNEGVVPQMANSLYQEQRFRDLPVLADALEEAGCTNEDILEHCRSGDVHVRGCWVVDLLLGLQ